MSKNKNRRYNYTDYNKVQNEEFKMETVEPVNEAVEEAVEETTEESMPDLSEVTVTEPTEEFIAEVTEDTAAEEHTEEPIVEDTEDTSEDFKIETVEIIPKTGVVLKYSNIRQQPDPNSAVVGKLQVGQKAEVFGTFNGYWKIIAEPIAGVTVNGYIRSDLMNVE